MQKLLALVALAVCALPQLTHAADKARSDSDCAELIERWAGDPKAAPKRVIDECKNQLAAAPAAEPGAELAAAAVPTEPLASLDPCSAPDAASSVLCWGRWAALEPAADAPLATLNLPETPVDCAMLSTLAAQCVPQVTPLAAAVEGCAPGTPCGFATIVSGVTSTGDVEETEFGRFNLASDGTQYSVSPQTGSQSGSEINSVPMTTVVTPRPDGYDNLRASGRDGDVNSRLIARVEEDGNGAIQVAADVWTHGTRENAQSGYFAWGTTTSQGGLDSLNTGNITLSFSGPMSVNNATLGAMTLNFGTNPTWTGTWTNPAWSFGAGGTVTGANLISQPGQFTSNVVGSGNFVQGALVGEPGSGQGGRGGITHIIDVSLEGQGHIKDVGLLREVVPH